MLRYGYDRRFATGVIAASGTLAQIIPPSLVLIIMADQLGRSVGDMYEGAFIPGVTLAGLYALYALIVTLIKPKWAPALPQEARTLREPMARAAHARWSCWFSSPRPQRSVLRNTSTARTAPPTRCWWCPPPSESAWRSSRR